MAPQDTSPDRATRDAEKLQAKSEHAADRPATDEEQAAADAALDQQTEADRTSVAEHERDMAERGTHQKGEGRIE